MNLYKTLVGIVRAIWITLSNVWSIGPYLIWMLLLRPLLYVRPKWYWQVESIMFNWLMAIVASWMWTCGHRVVEQGDDVRELYDDEAVLLSNHLSMGDTPVLMYTLQHHVPASRTCVWIMYKLFKWTQFGMVSQVHGDFFIGMGKSTLVDLEKFLRGPYKDRWRKWIVLFPEGAFLKNVIKSSQRFAEKNGHPKLQNVALPRMGALQTIVDTLNVEKEGKTEKPIKYIIDLTIGYPENKPLDFANVTFNKLPPRNVNVYYRIYPISEVPLQADKLQEWAFNMWQEKEDMLEEFYRTGKFPEIPDSKRCHGVKRMEKRTLDYTAVKMIGYHFMFLISCFIQYKLFAFLLGLIF